MTTKEQLDKDIDEILARGDLVTIACSLSNAGCLYGYQQEEYVQCSQLLGKCNSQKAVAIDIKGEDVL